MGRCASVSNKMVDNKCINSIRSYTFSRTTSTELAGQSMYFINLYLGLDNQHADLTAQITRQS